MTVWECHSEPPAPVILSRLGEESLRLFSSWRLCFELLNKDNIKNIKQEFNEKLFRSQLSYFEDINYAEKIIYKKDFEVDDKIIKKELIKFSLN